MAVPSPSSPKKMAQSCCVAMISRLLYRAAPTSMLMPTANNHIRSLKYLHAEKNDEKFRQTFGGINFSLYFCPLK